jgi:hypothetical protein
MLARACRHANGSVLPRGTSAACRAPVPRARAASAPLRPAGMRCACCQARSRQAGPGSSCRREGATHSCCSLVMAPHSRGSGPVSWLLLRPLRARPRAHARKRQRVAQGHKRGMHGACPACAPSKCAAVAGRHALRMLQATQRAGGARQQLRAGRGYAQVLQTGHGAPLPRQWPGQLVVVEQPARPPARASMRTAACFAAVHTWHAGCVSFVCAQYTPMRPSSARCTCCQARSGRAGPGSSCGREGATHSSCRLVMAPHSRGSGPVSWLLYSCLRARPRAHAQAWQHVAQQRRFVTQGA